MKRLHRIDVSDQWCNRDLSTRVNKKRNGITILAATVNDPMRRRGKEAIAPGFHDVADVNKGAGEEEKGCSPCDEGELDTLKGGGKGFQGYCNFCNKWGHRKSECRSFTAALGKSGGKGEEKGNP